MKDSKNIAKQIKIAPRNKLSRNLTNSMSMKPFSLGNPVGLASISPCIKTSNFSKLTTFQRILKGANSITLSSSSYNFVKKGSIVNSINKMKLRYHPHWDIYYMSEDVKHVGNVLKKSISKMKDQH